MGTTLVSASLFQPATPSSASFHPSRNWLMNLHPSHRLWTAGGLAFCSECGALSQGCSRTRLSIGCGTRSGKKTTRPRQVGQNPRPCKTPAGSVWRTKQLLAGRLRGVGKSEWPDGTPGSTIAVPSRIFPFPVNFPTGNRHPIDIGEAVHPDSVPVTENQG